MEEGGVCLLRTGTYLPSVELTVIRRDRYQFRSEGHIRREVGSRASKKRTEVEETKISVSGGWGGVGAVGWSSLERRDYDF